MKGLILKEWVLISSEEKGVGTVSEKRKGLKEESVIEEVKALEEAQALVEGYELESTRGKVWLWWASGGRRDGAGWGAWDKEAKEGETEASRAFYLLSACLPHLILKFYFAESNFRLFVTLQASK